jgi:hypothetical protein
MQMYVGKPIRNQHIEIRVYMTSVMKCRMLNYAASENLAAKSTMFLHLNIHKFTRCLLMERLAIKLAVFYR